MLECVFVCTLCLGVYCVLGYVQCLGFYLFIYFEGVGGILNGKLLISGFKCAIQTKLLLSEELMNWGLTVHIS